MQVKKGIFIIAAVCFLPTYLYGMDGQDLLANRAANGDSVAMYQLGCRYMQQNTPQALTLAKEWLERAAQQGYVYARYQLACIAEKADHQNALDLFRKAAADGEPLSQLKVANVLASDAAHVNAALYLEDVLENCIQDVVPLYDRAYIDAIITAKVEAACKLAPLYATGLGVEHLIDRAADLYNRALILHPACEIARYGLATLLLSANPQAHDKIQAQQLLEGISSHAPGLCLLGNVYRDQGDFEKAKTCYRKARKESPEACFNLGKLTEERRINVNRSQKAVVYYKRAARAGHEEAVKKIKPLAEQDEAIQFLLGCLYFEGKGSIKKDETEAIAWFKKVGLKGNLAAIKQLVELQIPAALLALGEIYEEFVNSGRREFPCLLGELFVSTRGPWGTSALKERLMEHAAHFYWLAAQGALPEAAVRLENLAAKNYGCIYFALGHVFHEGLAGKSKDHAKALEFYRKAHATGYEKASFIARNLQDDSPESTYRLAIAYKEGVNVAKDPEQAVRLLMEAAFLGHEQARSTLMRMADSRNVAALLALALGLELGPIFQTIDLARASTFYGHAARLGASKAKECLLELAQKNPSAQYEVGCLFCDGEGWEKNLIEAAEWLNKAARQGHAKAIEKLEYLATHETLRQAAYFLGNLFCVYPAGNPDVQKAVIWYQKASQLGSAEAALNLGDIFIAGKGPVAKDIKRGLEYLIEAARGGCIHALDHVIVMARNDNEARFLLGDYYYTPGRAQKIDEAEKWLARAARGGHVPACYKLAQLLERKPLPQELEPAIIIRSYRDIRDLYQAAAAAGYADAKEQHKRVQKTIGVIEQLRGDFNNILFGKLQPRLSNECGHEFLFWAAAITDIAQIKFSETIRPLIVECLLIISRFSNEQLLTRALLDKLLTLIQSAAFGSQQLSEEGEAFRISELFRFCKGIQSLYQSQKGFMTESARALRIDEHSIADFRIEMYNLIFKQDDEPCSQEEYEAATEKLMDEFNSLSGQQKITQDMLEDEAPADAQDGEEWEKRYGSIDSLFNLLSFGQTTRWKNRMLRMIPMLMRLDSDTRAGILASWAIGGLHCSTRAECETYQFYIRNLTDSTSIKKNCLAMRFALCLAELRRKLMEKLIVEDARERIHQIAYLERKVGKMLGLVGDAVNFSDAHEYVVDRSLRLYTAEQLKNMVLSMYTIPAMCQHIVQEANKRDPSLPYADILKYLKECLGDEAYVLLQDLYDENGLLTEHGALVLLEHFGYLERNN